MKKVANMLGITTLIFFIDMYALRDPFSFNVAQKVVEKPKSSTQQFLSDWKVIKEDGYEIVLQDASGQTRKIVPVSNPK